jgi:uncharacterized delta-60 repeat protein
MIKINSNSLNLKGGKTLVGDFEYEFGNPSFTFNGWVRTVIQQSDGKLVAGGEFTTYSGSANNYIVRINSNGTKDTTFNIGTGFEYVIDTIIQQSDGKLVAGGRFVAYSGSANNRIVRINPDGTKDTTFNIGTGFNGNINTIIQQSDGKLVVGGDFTTYSGSTSQGIIRINPDGTNDTTFNIGTGFDYPVYSIIQQSDSKLVVGGYFLEYSGSANNYIVRINSNGTKDTTFNIGTGFSDPVLTIIQQSDGKLVVGGYFYDYSGSLADFIVRINPDGTNDTTLAGLDNYSYSIIQQSDGKLVVVGSFIRYSGSISNKIVRINPDGTNDTTFNTGTGFDLFDNDPDTIIQQSDGKLVVGGDFTTYSGSVAERMVLINPDGTTGGQSRRIN